MDMTTRDFARFGLLYLRGGLWDGRQIVPTAWVDETRVPAATNARYGLHWWLRPDGRVFAASALVGQRIVVVPGRGPRRGRQLDARRRRQASLVDAVLDAFGAAPAAS